MAGGTGSIDGAPRPRRVGPRGAGGGALTSGSSGAPRAAVLSTRALDAAARASAEVLRTTRTDRWLLSLPLAHVGGLSIAYRAWRGAGEVVFGDGAPFEASAFHALLTREAVTVASVVPTMLARLVRASLPSPASLRVLLVGGAAAPDALIAAATELGYPVRATYGLTETAAQLATAPGTAAAARVVPGMEIRAPSGVLEVRGPQLFSGYVGGEPVSPNDWWSTRDAGEVTSDGVVRVLGRVDDVIVSGGENVQPLEVESVLTGCPGVDAVCVVGVPDAEWGERVVGVVAGVALRADLDAFAAARLAAFKCPKHWVHVEAVPVTANGKLDRGVARSLAVAASAEPRPVGDA
ncbi:MAG: AMP-binding protein [Polyangiales bacterium]